MNEQVDFSSLSKKERKRLKREMERQEQMGKAKKTNMVKWFVVGFVVVLLGVGGWFLVKEFSKPLPGQQMAEQGRDHVAKEQWEKFAYNSNPPTSGPHDEVWTKAGVYGEPQGDGHLVHSLEHGYVIISYHCDEKVSSSIHRVVGIVYAHLIEDEATDSAEATSSNTLKGDVWTSEDCKELKKQLSDVANDKELRKLIVVPRQNLDARIALTAWTRIEKLNDFDRERIVAFIDAHRNHGPEQTME